MRNKKSKNQLFKLSGPLTDALIDDLKLKLKLSSELSVESDISIFDSFDWRLYKSGHLLIKEEAKYSFYNYKKDKVIFEEQSKSRKLPVFSNDFPQGGLNKELSKRLSIRALIKIAVIKNKLKTFRVLNDDEKTVSRLKIQHLGSKKSKLPGQYYIAAEPVRGYSSEFSMVKSILLNLGLDKTDINPYIEALISNGVLPGSYSSKFKLEIAPDSSSSQALRQILTHLLNTIKVNEHGIRNDIDIEFLHDFRVAVRRARSALSQFKYVFPENITTKLKNDFSKIGKMTNRLRDLDVYLLKKDEYKSMLPEKLRPGIEPVFDRLKKEREAEQRKISSELLSDNYRAIINTIGFFPNGESVFTKHFMH